MAPITFLDVVNSMRDRKPITISRPGYADVTGTVNAIEAEDGSGRSWNIRLSHPTHGTLSVYWHETRHAR